MKLFRLPKRDPARFQGESPRQRLFRIILITLLFCAMFWGFWMRNERGQQVLDPGRAGPESGRTATPGAANQALYDGTGSLGERQRLAIEEYAAKFAKTYGMGITIAVSGKTLDDKTALGLRRENAFFIFLSPGEGAVEIAAPPLAAAALGNEFILYLRNDHFKPYFAGGNWPEGLASALSLLAKRLDAALAAPGIDTERQQRESHDPKK